MRGNPDEHKFDTIPEGAEVIDLLDSDSEDGNPSKASAHVRTSAEKALSTEKVAATKLAEGVGAAVARAEAAKDLASRSMPPNGGGDAPVMDEAVRAKAAGLAIVDAGAETQGDTELDTAADTEPDTEEEDEPLDVDELPAAIEESDDVEDEESEDEPEQPRRASPAGDAQEAAQAATAHHEVALAAAAASMEADQAAESPQQAATASHLAAPAPYQAAAAPNQEAGRSGAAPTDPRVLPPGMWLTSLQYFRSIFYPDTSDDDDDDEAFEGWGNSPPSSAAAAADTIAAAAAAASAAAASTGDHNSTEEGPAAADSGGQAADPAPKPSKRKVAGASQGPVKRRKGTGSTTQTQQAGLPPGWTRNMNFGKLEGYRPPPHTRWPRAKSCKEAWEIHRAHEPDAADTLAGGESPPGADPQPEEAASAAAAQPAEESRDPESTDLEPSELAEAQPEPMSNRNAGGPSGGDSSPLGMLSAAAQPAALAAAVAAAMAEAPEAREAPEAPKALLSSEAQIELLHVVRGWQFLTSDLLVLQERGLTLAQLKTRVERLRTQGGSLTAQEKVQALLEADETDA